MLKQVSISEAARAFRTGVYVWGETGAGVCTTHSAKWSMNKARALILKFRDTEGGKLYVYEEDLAAI